VEPAGPEVVPAAALVLVGTVETGALPGTSQVELTAGTSDFELAAGISGVAELAGTSGVGQQAVAGIFEVGQFALLAGTFEVGL